MPAFESSTLTNVVFGSLASAAGLSAASTARLWRVFTLPSKFVGSAVSNATIPPLPRAQPEVAFMGRSNCGKSSLINALLGVRKLVKTAKRPGHTAMLNFFTVGDAVTVTDMPGYGFGSRPEWGTMIVSYLEAREQLKRVCLLVDARRGFLPLDRDVMAILDRAQRPFQVVFTKQDKVSAEALQRLMASAPSTLSAYPAWTNQVLSVSAHKQTGIDDLRHSLVRVCFPSLQIESKV